MQITFIIKGKNVKFSSRMGNLRTRGNFKRSGLARLPAAPPYRPHLPAPAVWAAQSSPPASPSSSLSPPLPAAGSFLRNRHCLEMKSEAQRPHRPLAPASEFPEKRVRVTRVPETGGTGSPPWTLGQITCPGPPSRPAGPAPAAPRPGSASCGPPAGPAGAPPSSAVLIWESWPGLSRGGRPGPLPPALRSSVALPQQGPEEKVMLRDC